MGDGSRWTVDVACRTWRRTSRPGCGSWPTRSRPEPWPLLVVNDRILKPWAGGLTGALDAPADRLTGKLSDVAGVLLVALLTGVLTGRSRASLIAVGLAFTALKLSPTVADLAAPLLGGTTRTDPTDLLALLALPLAGRVLRSATGATDPTPAAGDAPAGPSQVASVARRTPAPVLTALVLVLTVPAVTATSCNEPVPLDTIGVGADGALYARIGSPLSPEARGALDPRPGGSRPERSVDHGGGARSERRPDLPARSLLRRLGPQRRRGPHLDGAAGAAAGRDRHPRRSPGRGGLPDAGPCYRVTTDGEGRGLVEEGGDGRWTPSFAHSDEEWERMELRANDCSGTATEGDGFRSVTVVEDTVLVAMGSQGVLRREPGGGWERIAVGGTEPIRTDGPTWFATLVQAPLVLAVAGVGLLFLALLRGRSGWRAMAAGGLAVIGAGFLMAVAAWLDLNATDYATLGPGIALAAIAVFVVSLLLALVPGRRTSSAAPGSGAAGLAPTALVGLATRSSSGLSHTLDAPTGAGPAARDRPASAQTGATGVSPSASSADGAFGADGASGPDGGAAASGGGDCGSGTSARRVGPRRIAVVGVVGQAELAADGGQALVGGLLVGGHVERRQRVLADAGRHAGGRSRSLAAHPGRTRGRRRIGRPALEAGARTGR